MVRPRSPAGKGVLTGVVAPCATSVAFAAPLVVVIGHGRRMRRGRSQAYARGRFGYASWDPLDPALHVRWVEYLRCVRDGANGVPDGGARLDVQQPGKGEAARMQVANDDEEILVGRDDGSAQLRGSLQVLLVGRREEALFLSSQNVETSST